MPLRSDTDRIVRLGLGAIEKAERFYMKVSCDRTVRSAPESFLQTEIFRSLVGVFPRQTLEENTAQVLRDLQVNEGAITDTIRKGRIDILVWKTRADGSFVPRYPIEVKKISGLGNLINDVERLVAFREFSPRGRKIRRAFIFVCCVRGSKDSVEELLTNVRFPAGRSISPRVKLGKSIATTRRNGTPAWFGSACYYF